MYVMFLTSKSKSSKLMEASMRDECRKASKIGASLSVVESWTRGWPSWWSYLAVLGGSIRA